MGTNWSSGLAGLILLFGWSGVSAGSFPQQGGNEAVAAPGFRLGTSLPEKSERLVRYDIDVFLDPEEEGTRTRRIHGQETVTWRNTQDGPASELLWHVYNNAWSGPGSLWLQQARSFGDDNVPLEWGSTKIESIQLVGTGAPAPLQGEWVPQEGAPEDKTVWRVPLPVPVAPGESVTVKLVFTTLLPPAFRRNGAGAGGYVHAAQWFPKLGVFEELDGRLQWNCEPYQYMTEFYADYGEFRVRLTLPDRYLVQGALKVAASGSLESLKEGEEGEGTITCTFTAEDIHDFAWSADPDFLRVERDFDPAQWRDGAEEERVAAALGRSVEEVRPRPVKMILMLQPEHQEYRERYLDSLAKALYYFGLWYGPYPYETISLIDPASNARHTGGMEYPRLITGGVSKGNPPRMLSPEGVTVHEFGHQFWYGLVGNDEFRYAWLDEGFNTFSTGRVLRKGWPPALATYELLGSRHYGRPLLAPPSYGKGDLRSWLTFQRIEVPAIRGRGPFSAELRRRTPLERWISEVPPASYLPRVEQNAAWSQRSAFSVDWGDPMSRPTKDLGTPGMRRINAYSRPALILETMAGLMGELRWTRALRAYHETWRFRHPRPDDFRQIVAAYGAGSRVGGEQGVRVDWDSFWEQALLGNDRLDFGVRRILNQPSAAAGEAGGEAPEAKTWDVTVEVRRYGGMRLPVAIRVEWDDGTRTDMAWDGQDTWWRFQKQGSARKVRAVLVDPERHLPLDSDWTNNFRLAEPDRARSKNIGLRTLIWAQQVLQYYGGVG